MSVSSDSESTSDSSNDFSDEDRPFFAMLDSSSSDDEFDALFSDSDENISSSSDDEDMPSSSDEDAQLDHESRVVRRLFPSTTPCPDHCHNINRYVDVSLFSKESSLSGKPIYPYTFRSWIIPDLRLLAVLVVKHDTEAHWLVLPRPRSDMRPCIVGSAIEIATTLQTSGLF